MKALLESLLFPPGLWLLVGAWGLVLWQRRRAALALLLLALVGAYLSSLPITAYLLLDGLQSYPALAPDTLPRRGTEAVVVLAAGRLYDAPEYGGDTVSGLTLERLRYGVRLSRRSGLPLVVVGGQPESREQALATLMAEAARDDFMLPPLALETRSRSTWENAAFTAALLARHGIRQTYLVTHAWHMPRAMLAFRAAAPAITVLPAPTGFVVPNNRLWMNGLPSPRALYRVHLAFHEYLGLLYYRLKSTF